MTKEKQAGTRAADEAPPEGKRWVYSKYITRNGRRIFRKDGGVFRFAVDA